MRFLIAGLILPLFAVNACAQEPKKAYAQEYVHVFKGTDKVAGWRLVGPAAEDCVKFEPEGLHIKLPTGWDGNRPGTGLQSEFGVRGDFEITMNFEILQEPTREEAVKGGTRVAIVLFKRTKEADRFDLVTINRSVYAKQGTRFHAWAQTWDETAQKNRIQNHFVPTDAKTGKLRLVRSGSDLYYGLGEGPDGKVEYHAKFDYGSEDLSEVRLTGATTGNMGSLDFRVSEVRVRADAIPKAPPQAVVGVPNAKVEAAVVQPAPPRRGWLMAALIIGGVLLLVLVVSVVGTWAFLRSRRLPQAAIDETAIK